MREFNTTGLCNPNKHYMVDITEKLVQIEKMIAKGKYFTINRARQYGKTTTLRRLRRFLAENYTVISLSFESWGDSNFSTEKKFCQTFLEEVAFSLKQTQEEASCGEGWLNLEVDNFKKLQRHISNLCQGKKMVLMIDEVDKIANNRIFLNFLGILRDSYLDREDEIAATFQSVILTGLYDIKNIKLKMIGDGTYLPLEEENHLRNSPWNIASEFNVQMSFSVAEIITMLEDYEQDMKTGMDIKAVSEELFSYTNGYPFMVSRLCQLVHDKLDKDWTRYGVRKAVSFLVREDNQLFSDMSKNLENNRQLYESLYAVLILGHSQSFSYDNPVIEMASRYGYIKDWNGKIQISNKIFETRMMNYFVSKNEIAQPLTKTNALYHRITVGETFQMELCLQKFAEFYQREIYPTKNKKFLEEHYRIVFLTYLKPLLNGIGHYHQESKLMDDTRMDLVVNYFQQEFIIELKRIFRESDRTDGIQQLLEYMKKRNAATGYFLTFDFRKKSEFRSEWIELEGRRILEISV